jgi:branched-chain amino acid transport system permease protein
MQDFIQILIRSLETGSIFALAALGIIIIFRTSVMQNFAQGSLGMFNAFIATYFVMWTGAPNWVAAIVGMIAALFVGIIIDIVVMRQAKKVSPLSKQIITLGLIMVFLGIAPLIFGVIPLQFGKFINGGVDIAGVYVDYNSFLNIAIGIVIMVGLFYFLQNTKWGLAVRVTASNEPTARLMGVPTRTVTMGAWAIAAALGTLSALMLAPRITVNVNMMNDVQVNALIASVLGGFQTFYGPVLGAYIISFARNILSFYVSSTWADPLLYIGVLSFIVFRPNGIIGKKIVKKV